MGLSPAEIKSLTAAQYAAALKAYDNERRLLDFQFAWTRFLLAEPHRDSKKKPQPYKVEDFLCFDDGKGQEVAKKDMTPDQQLNFIKNFVQPFFPETKLTTKDKRDNTE